MTEKTKQKWIRKADSNAKVWVSNRDRFYSKCLNNPQCFHDSRLRSLSLRKTTLRSGESLLKNLSDKTKRKVSDHKPKRYVWHHNSVEGFSEQHHAQNETRWWSRNALGLLCLQTELSGWNNKKVPNSLQFPPKSFRHWKTSREQFTSINLKELENFFKREETKIMSWNDLSPFLLFYIKLVVLEGLCTTLERLFPIALIWNNYLSLQLVQEMGTLPSAARK